MEIWNSRSLDNNQRFIAAIAAGFAAAVILGIAYGGLYSVLRVTSGILYVFIGWCIGQVIRRAGRGVHMRFGVVGAVMTLLAIIIGDSIAMFGFGHFEAISIGTVIIALVNGALIGFFTTILDKIFSYIDLLPLRGTYF